MEVNCAAGVGVGDQPFEDRCPVDQRAISEGVEDHVGAHVRGHPPADDHAGEGVDDEADVGDPRPGGHVGEVGHPECVRALGGEVALDQVGRARGAVVVLGW